MTKSIIALICLVLSFSACTCKFEVDHDVDHHVTLYGSDSSMDFLSGEFDDEDAGI